MFCSKIIKNNFALAQMVASAINAIESYSQKENY
jgi:hypothetical protein